MKYIFLILFVVVYTGVLNAKVYPDAIKRKIISYLIKKNISVQNDDIKIKNTLPNYKLYDITIKNFVIQNNKIIVNIIISNFFDKTQQKNLQCSVDEIISPEKYRINSEVKLLYNINNIQIKDVGKIMKKEGGYYFIKNSFGKIIKCIRLKDNLFKVLE